MKLRDCREATRLVSQGLDRKLDLTERLALRLHVFVCRNCLNVSRQMAFLREAVGRLPEQRQSERDR